MIYQEGDLIISGSSRGLRYGDGLFETMKCKNNHLLSAQQHFARLWKGLETLQFDIPKHFTSVYLEQQIHSLIKKNGQEDAVRIRLNIFRSDGGLNDPKDNLPNYIIETWDLSADAGKWNSNGLILSIYNEVKKSCDILSNLKHNNYLPSVMAALYAKKQKVNDVLVLNSFNRICESSIANVFLIKEEVIYTPPLSEGCVAGILRNFLIEQLDAEGFMLKEKIITPEDVMNADEIFLTNSITNIRWVKQIGNKEFTNKLTQKIYTAIISKIL